MLANAHLASGVTITRVSLHILAACVWIGGQIIMGGLVPTLRSAGEDVPAKAARAFARLSWPAYGVLVLTGFWNAGSVTNHHATTWGWNFTLMFKLGLVALAGVAAFAHGRATTASRRGMTAGVTLLASLGAMVLGVALAG